PHSGRRPRGRPGPSPRATDRRASVVRMRRRGKIALGAAGLVVAVAVAGIPVLVVPASDDPATVEADVAFVIGPPTDARMEVAYDLIAEGRADALMVSLDPAEAADWPLAAQAC